MNHTRINTFGVDVPIQRVQNLLYKELSKLGTIDGYGRVYKNKRATGNVLESYTGNKEYNDVLELDTSRFFFVVDEDKESEGGSASSRVDVVFMVDLDDLYDDAERADERLKSLVNTILQDSWLKPTRFFGHERLNAILRDFDLGDSLDYGHMHPKLIFTAQGDISYNLTTCL